MHGTWITHPWAYPHIQLRKRKVNGLFFFLALIFPIPTLFSKILCLEIFFWNKILTLLPCFKFFISLTGFRIKFYQDKQIDLCWLPTLIFDQISILQHILAAPQTLTALQSLVPLPLFSLPWTIFTVTPSSLSVPSSSSLLLRHSFGSIPWTLLGPSACSLTCFANSTCHIKARFNFWSLMSGATSKLFCVIRKCWLTENTLV